MEWRERGTCGSAFTGLTRKEKRKGEGKGKGRAIGEVGNVYFFSLHSLDGIYVAAAIYSHGEVMLDIYCNDLYMEIHFNCFTVLFYEEKKTDDDDEDTTPHLSSTVITIMTIPITNHHQKKNPKRIPPLPKNLRRSIPMKTVLAQPLPIHSTPHRMKKKIRSQKPPSQRRRRTKKRLGEQVPIRTVYVQSLHTHCRGVVIVK